MLDMCGAGDGQGRLPGYRELGHAHIGKVVPEQRRYVRPALCENVLRRLVDNS